MRRLVFILFALSLGCGLCAGESARYESALLPVAATTETAPAAAGGGEGGAIKDGNALLDSLLTLFDNIPVVKVKKTPESEVKMSGGLKEVDNRLSQLAKDASIALEAGVIDKIFYNRYKRMLTIYKMIITPVVKNELLENPFIKTFEDFVWDVTYERWAWGDKDSIAKMAAAMEEEFVQLKVYLDTMQKREEMKKKLGYRLLPPPPPPPGKKKLEEAKPE
jgi:hypothetical protein